jgi:hypothetical protein
MICPFRIWANSFASYLPLELKCKGRFSLKTPTSVKADKAGSRGYVS